MPDAATVCQCNTVTQGRAGALLAGRRPVASTTWSPRTRATTGCGTCRDAVEGIVDWLSTVDTRAEVALR